MLKQFHLATQYLATAGKSFLKHQSDDSHTNVGFFSEDHTIRTWFLDNSGTYLAFNFDDFTLLWVSKQGKVSFKLDGKTHVEIVRWILKMASTSSLQNTYNYDLHYDLPYTISDDFKFKLLSPKDLNQLLQLRVLAQNTLTIFLNHQKLESEIRIWPHHLDTGAFVALNDNSGKSVGLGMAIPDSVMGDHYFYISGYMGHNSIETDKFSKLTHGEWKNDGFKGAVLNATETTSQQVIQFFKEAYEILKK